MCLRSPKLTHTQTQQTIQNSRVALVAVETWRSDVLTDVRILSVCQSTLSINVIVLAAADAFWAMMFVE